jgi:hypothetical protein
MDIREGSAQAIRATVAFHRSANRNARNDSELTGVNELLKARISRKWTYDYGPGAKEKDAGSTITDAKQPGRNMPHNICSDSLVKVLPS